MNVVRHLLVQQFIHIVIIENDKLSILYKNIITGDGKSFIGPNPLAPLQLIMGVEKICVSLKNEFSTKLVLCCM